MHASYQAVALVVVIACSVQATIASDRGKEVAQLCAACHGVNGNTTMASNTPRLAGQLREVIALQLRHYAGGERPHSVMSPIASKLTAQEIADVAEWYATRPPMRDGALPAQDDTLRRGETLFRQGKAGVQACQLCHGAQGEGKAPAAARLAGQHAEYLSTAINRYRSSADLKSPSALAMKLAVTGLDDTDVKAVTAYLQSLH